MKKSDVAVFKYLTKFGISSPTEMSIGLQLSRMTVTRSLRALKEAGAITFERHGWGRKPIKVDSIKVLMTSEELKEKQVEQSPLGEL